MKYLMLTLLILAIGFCKAQNLKESEIPSLVKAAFTTRFPKATKVEWSKESETEFEAEFKNNNSEQSASFTSVGKWLATETTVDKASLPTPVKATITRDFAGYKIDEAEKMEIPNSQLYEVELSKGKSKLEVQISNDGKVLKKEDLKE